MDHGQVAVERHEGEKEHRAVEAEIVGAVHQLAKRFSEDPLVGVVNGLKRERDGKNDVGGHQVEEEQIRDRGQLLELVDDEENDSVAEDAGDEDDVVKGRKKVFVEIVEVDGAALQSMAIADLLRVVLVVLVVLVVCRRIRRFHCDADLRD